MMNIMTPISTCSYCDSKPTFFVFRERFFKTTMKFLCEHHRSIILATEKNKKAFSEVLR